MYLRAQQPWFVGLFILLSFYYPGYRKMSDGQTETRKCLLCLLKFLGLIKKACSKSNLEINMLIFYIASINKHVRFKKMKINMLIFHKVSIFRHVKYQKCKPTCLLCTEHQLKSMLKQQKQNQLVNSLSASISKAS